MKMNKQFLKTHFLVIKAEVAVIIIAVGFSCSPSPSNKKNNDIHPTTDSVTDLLDTSTVPKKMLEQSLREFAQTPDPQDKLEALMEAVYNAEDIPEEKDKVVQQLADFTETVPDCERKVVSYIKLGTIYQDDDIARSLMYYQKAMNLISHFSKNGNLLKASALTAIAYTSYRNGDYDYGLKCALEAIPILEATSQQDIASLKKISININNTLYRAYVAASNIYDITGQQDKKKEYTELMLKVAEKCSSPYDNASGYLQYAYAIADDKPEEALQYINKAFKIGIDNGYVNIVTNSFDAYSVYEEDQGNIPAARDYLIRSLKFLNGKNKPDIEVNVYYNLITLYPKDEKKQMEFSIKGLIIADSLKSKFYSSQFNKYLGTLNANAGKYAEAYKYYVKYDSINNELFNEQSQSQINYMSARFDADRQKLQITALQKQKEFIMWLSIAGGGVLLLILTVFFFLWRLTMQRRRVAEQQKQLAEQHVTQLEQEKRLVATQSVLDGETHERSRLARDLHDGLGSMLTGVKLNLMEMKKGAVLEYIDVERFNRALELLDESVQEMRRVAHHLMPDSLARFGLKPAVSDFCSNFPQVKFAYFGDDSRLDPNLEVMIYRTIHELVNNALKHSHATEIFLQIMQEPDRIAFTVQDNGCGFDPETKTDGTGLQNIRDRVIAFNGIISIDSKIGQGTEINVELMTNDKSKI